MSRFTTRDGVDIFYKDWGAGQPIIFSHGWPLNADVWDQHMLVAASNGYRAIAHDRRGYGRSSQPWAGHDMNTYADDLAELIETLELRDVVLVGHSTGGGEITRYIGRHGTSNISKVILISAVPPLLLRTDGSPEGKPATTFESIRDSITTDRSQYFKNLSSVYYGANRSDAEVSQGVLDAFWFMSMQAGLKSVVDGVKTFSETDFTHDLRQFDVPTLIMHGEDDQLVPIEATAKLSAEIVPCATLRTYKGAPHGLVGAFGADVSADALSFIRSNNGSVVPT